MAVFATPQEAVAAAVGIQRAVREEPVTDLPRYRVGIGLAHGGAVPIKGDYIGLTVHRAHQLCSLVGAGDVVADVGFVEAAGAIPGISFQDRGPALLRGSSSVVQVMRVVSAAVDPR